MYAVQGLGLLVGGIAATAWGVAATVAAAGGCMTVVAAALALTRHQQASSRDRKTEAV